MVKGWESLISQPFQHITFLNLYNFSILRNGIFTLIAGGINNSRINFKNLNIDVRKRSGVVELN
jgi:hypothetical protein